MSLASLINICEKKIEIKLLKFNIIWNEIEIFFFLINSNLKLGKLQLSNLWFDQNLSYLFVV